MIELVVYDKAYYDRLNYQLVEEQARFTATIDYCLNERKDLHDITKTVVVILSDGHPAGFFVLDCGDDKFVLTDNPKSAMIRSFSLNPDFQGQGIGREAMVQVPDFIRGQMLDINELALSVNFRNIIAYQVYIKAGYADNGKVIAGPAGDQHVLTKLIL